MKGDKKMYKNASIWHERMSIPHFLTRFDHSSWVFKQFTKSTFP